MEVLAAYLIHLNCTYFFSCQLVMELPVRHPPLHLRDSYQLFLRPAMHANYVWPAGQAAPSPPGGNPRLDPLPGYAKPVHAQSIAIEAKKMAVVFANNVALRIREHLEDVLSHFLSNRMGGVSAQTRATLGTYAAMSFVLSLREDTYSHENWSF
mgnify:CR=1 FL=1